MTEDEEARPSRTEWRFNPETNRIEEVEVPDEEHDEGEEA